ncbi:hypothetical protein FTV88_2315 [Heliorestis convoluta]|uniref:Uncharacterized protein n=1 Tax=Heliorestis convoluta TaxID=356322 RepID=A0A5Q2N3G9_9FIRM|nr:hypothetical protein FTV88_2315 [Heliorestis convoluta]
MLTIMAVVIYTINYGRQQWRNGLKLAAVTTYLLALMAFTLPILLLFFLRS